MRLRITLHTNVPVRLKLNYNELLQGIIYRHLQDSEYAKFVHDEGFALGHRMFKLFTFSRMTGDFTLDLPSKQIIFSNFFSFFVSSVDSSFIYSLKQGLEAAGSLSLQRSTVEVYNVECLSNPITNNRYRIKMLSPFTLHRTYETLDGKRKTVFFSPNDIVFSEMIRDNLLNKYEAYTKRKTTDKFKIRPLRITDKEKIVQSYKRFKITGWNGEYEIVGSKEIVKFAYDVGLGSRNSQGFGMFQIVRSI